MAEETHTRRNFLRRDQRTPLLYDFSQYDGSHKDGSMLVVAGRPCAGRYMVPVRGR